VSDRWLLERLQRGPATGVELAQAGGVSRAAIWKRVQALRAAGVEIAAHPGRGYALAQPLELLDRDRILSALSSSLRAAPPALQICFETGSTQTLAAAVAPPERGCAIWLAERQTAGQGRRGRPWISPLAAHLSMSVARRFQQGFAALSGLSLVVGVAAAEALHALGFPQVRLKWPNDLWVDESKLGGILIELRGEVSGPCDAVIGLGINVRMPPAFAAKIDQDWCDLATLSPAVPSRNLVASGVINALLPALDQFEREGLAPFLPRWRALDALVGQPVRVLEGDRMQEGIAHGIDEHGALRVQHGQNERHYHGGEVSLRSAGTRECRGSHDDGSDRTP
jgi:BirA family biotin operon repressor/biotin-[acetyl-CoA-carboxylase] ligase